MKSTKVTVLVSAMAAVLIFNSGCHQPSVGTNGTNSVSIQDVSQDTPAIATWQNNSNAWTAVISATTDALKSAKQSTTTGSNIVQVTAATPDGACPTNYFAYDYSRKNDFVEAAKAGIDDLDQNAAEFLRLVSVTPNGIDTHLQEKVQQISSQREDLARRYNNIKRASAANWGEMKSAFEKSYYNFKAILKAGEEPVTAKI